MKQLSPADYKELRSAGILHISGATVTLKANGTAHVSKVPKR